MELNPESWQCCFCHLGTGRDLLVCHNLSQGRGMLWEAPEQQAAACCAAICHHSYKHTIDLLFLCFPKRVPLLFIPKQCFLCFWHSTSEGVSLIQQEPPWCSGIKQNSMISPGQLLLAIRFAAAKEFLFKRQCQPSHCPQQMVEVPASSCEAAVVSLCSPTTVRTMNLCWWTDLPPSLSPGSFRHKPKQAVIYHSSSCSSVLSYV